MREGSRCQARFASSKYGSFTLVQELVRLNHDALNQGRFRTGSARGQSQLRQAFEFTNSYCMPQPEILVFRAHEKFDAQGKLTDEKTAEFLKQYLAALRAWALRLRQA